MNITYLELPAKDLKAQKEYYSEALGLPVNKIKMADVNKGALLLKRIFVSPFQP